MGAKKLRGTYQSINIYIESYQSYNEVLPNQSTQEFIVALTQLIPRRGKASVIYTDNKKTFVAASKWFGKINNNEEIQN